MSKKNNKSAVAPIVSTVATIEPVAPVAPVALVAPAIVSTPLVAPVLVLPDNFAQMTPLQQMVVLGNLQKQLAPVVTVEKEAEIKKLNSEIAEFEAKIAERKEQLKLLGVGTRGRPAGSKNAPKTESEKAASEQAAEDAAAIAQFDAETAPAPEAQAPAPGSLTVAQAA